MTTDQIERTPTRVFYRTLFLQPEIKLIFHFADDMEQEAGAMLVIKNHFRLAKIAFELDYCNRFKLGSPDF